jgi:hypothetical protein
MIRTTAVPHPCRVASRRLACALAAACLALGASAQAWGQACKDKAVTLRDASVYERPATSFNTASGWVYGTPAAVLAGNVKVFVCATRTVSFGPIAQDWLQIAYWNGQKWQHGWVVADGVKVGTRQSGTGSLASIVERMLPLSAAYAQAPPVITTSPPGDAAAPPPPEAAPSAEFATAEGSALPQFYGMLYACMILGMLGKVLFDAVTEAGAVDWRARGRGAVVPLLVSPIIFLGIMKSVDATASAELTSFISIACVAFQNGFFWHTLFDRTGGVPRSVQPAAGA